MDRNMKVYIETVLLPLRKRIMMLEESQTDAYQMLTALACKEQARNTLRNRKRKERRNDRKGTK